jgi:hypothetical protein
VKGPNAEQRAAQGGRRVVREEAKAKAAKATGVSMGSSGVVMGQGTWADGPSTMSYRRSRPYPSPSPYSEP